MESITRNITTLNDQFGSIDYTILILTLSISAFIGVYFGCFGNKTKSTDEYLHGGRKMKTLPIAISLIASQLSGVTIMTIPAEMYFYGTQYYLIVPLMVLIIAVINYAFLPVFYENNFSNCNEYLQYRFSARVRQIITFVYVGTNILVLPVVIYIPSLAFSQATGTSIHLINAIVCSIGVFYTMLGGIKAVVWTDVIQAGVMVGSSMFIAIYGTLDVGGVGEVFSTANDGGRLELFNTHFDLTSRITFWTSSMGYSLAWLAYIGLNQNCVQRMVSVPTIQHARNAMWLFCIGFIFITSLTCYTGLLIYAKYFGCDPKTVNLIEKPDQMLPLYVQDTVGHLSGITGIFISCVFSAGLSTMSAIMNAVAAVIYQDYIKPIKAIGHSEQHAHLWMKGIVIGFGVYCVLMEVVIAKFAHLIDAMYSISSLLNGPTFGVFCLGVFWPWANKKGALAGTIVCIISMTYIIISNILMKFSGELQYPMMDTSVDNCTQMGINISQIRLNIAPEPNPIEFSLSTISFPWYTLIGGVILWLVAIPVSFFTGGNDLEKLDPALLAPFLRNFIKAKKSCDMQCTTKSLITKEGEMITEQIWTEKPLTN